MIGYIKGRVVDADGASVIVESGGVGYRVRVAPELVRPPGQEVELFVHTHVAQDGISLFGFATPSARDMFLSLIKVQGLGPQGAMKVLAGLGEDELRSAIESGDSLALQSVKGIGPRLADKIIFFLRGKLPETGAPGPSEAIQALCALGMKEPEAKRAVAAAAGELGPGAKVEEIVRYALRRGK